MTFGKVNCNLKKLIAMYGLMSPRLWVESRNVDISIPELWMWKKIVYQRMTPLSNMIKNEDVA